MRRKIERYQLCGQSTIEFLLIFGVVMAVVLVSFQRHLPRVSTAANSFFYDQVNALYGKPSNCGDNKLSPAENKYLTCCLDDGTC